MAVVNFIMVNVLERNGIILVKEDFLSYLQEVYFKPLYVPSQGERVPHSMEIQDSEANIKGDNYE